MVELPKKKVGIVACSGEEMPEGTVTRLAALKVLEQLRPDDTVTICLPLFLAGGEGDRAFARFYPTVALDGCQIRCAARATETYSGKPAASIVVSDFIAQLDMERPQITRRLDEAGLKLVDYTAERVAQAADKLLHVRWSRQRGAPMEMEAIPQPAPGLQEPVGAACSCGSDIPVCQLIIEGKRATLIALPLIFEQFRQAGKPPSDGIAHELLDTVGIYNPIPAGAEEAYTLALLREYAAYCAEKEAVG